MSFAQDYAAGHRSILFHNTNLFYLAVKIFETKKKSVTCQLLPQSFRNAIHIGPKTLTPQLSHLGTLWEHTPLRCSSVPMHIGSGKSREHAVSNR